MRSIAPFGVFIDLGGIDGLVHKSELSWNKVNNPETAYAIGDEVEAEVIDINHERGRISLSIRRLQPDPWQESVAKYKIGDVIAGTVTKLVNFGAFVRVEEGLEGLIHISELSNQRVAHPGDVVKEGDTLNLKIISLDSERHRLGLSLKQAEEPPARPAPRRGAPAPRAPGARHSRSDAVRSRRRGSTTPWRPRSRRFASSARRPSPSREAEPSPSPSRRRARARAESPSPSRSPSPSPSRSPRPSPRRRRAASPSRSPRPSRRARARAGRRSRVGRARARGRSAEPEPVAEPERRAGRRARARGRSPSPSPSLRPSSLIAAPVSPRRPPSGAGASLRFRGRAIQSACAGGRSER